MTFHQISYARAPYTPYAPSAMYTAPAYGGGLFRGMGEDPVTKSAKTGAAIIGAISLTSAAVSGYHGYKRNNSVGSAVGWFFLGAIFPVITPVVALAQGFGKPAPR